MSAKYIYHWLHLLFGSTVAGDIFQEKLYRVLKSVPSTTGTTHEVLCHGNAYIYIYIYIYIAHKHDLTVSIQIQLSCVFFCGQYFNLGLSPVFKYKAFPGSHGAKKHYWFVLFWARVLLSDGPGPKHLRLKKALLFIILQMQLIGIFFCYFFVLTQATGTQIVCAKMMSLDTIFCRGNKSSSHSLACFCHKKQKIYHLHFAIVKKILAWLIGRSNLGSITSHCSGNDPPLLPPKRDGHLGLLLLISTNQIDHYLLNCSNYFFWSSFQTADAKVLLGGGGASL